MKMTVEQARAALELAKEKLAAAEEALKSATGENAPTALAAVEEAKKALAAAEADVAAAEAAPVDDPPKGDPPPVPEGAMRAKLVITSSPAPMFDTDTTRVTEAAIVVYFGVDGLGVQGYACARMYGRGTVARGITSELVASADRPYDPYVGSGPYDQVSGTVSGATASWDRAPDYSCGVPEGWVVMMLTALAPLLSARERLLGSSS